MPHHPRRRGLSLAVTLLVLMVLSVMGLALAAQGVLNLQQIEHGTERAILVNAANGGLHELMDAIYQNTAYGRDRSARGSGTYTTSSGIVHYWWSFNPSDDGFSVNNLDTSTPRTGFGGRTVPPLSALVVVNADFVPMAQSRNPVRVGSVCSKNFRMAIATDGTISARDVRGVQGYPGNIWSNATRAPGSVTIAASSADGQVRANAPEGAIAIAGQPRGVHYYDAGRITIPDIPVQDVIASYAATATSRPYGGPATYASLGNVSASTNSQGRVDMTGDFVTQDGSRVTSVRIEPPAAGQPHVSIHVNGNLSIGGGAVLAPSIHWFVKDDMRINGSMTQLETGDSDNFLFVGGVMDFRGASASDLHLFSGKGIKQSGSSSYKGVMYVRDGYYDASGGGTSSDFQGIVLIRSIATGTGNLNAPSTNFTYDPDFLTAMERFNVSVKDESPVFTLSWWVMD